MTEVTLGEFSFDPVEPSDFRIAFEGASKTGKSNSLAVLLEDLAEVNLPTLVVERLGILSTVRTIDENMIVVGGRDEPGIDLAIPLESIEVVAEMVLERGLKVILDVSTYDVDDPDAHAEHRAAARVLKALNEDAAARLRAGSRRKCLVLVDEVHVLAPERGAPHIDLDDDVRRARAQLVTIATEGGNKGINFVAAYQRRAYTSKGVVSQMDNHVIHRLHRTDRDEAAREIGVDEDEIAELRERLEAGVDRSAPAGTGGEDVVETYAEFLDVDAVQERIEDAKAADDVVAKAVRGVIRTIVEEGGAVDYQTIADRLGYSGTSHVSSAASALAERDVVEKDRRGNSTFVDLALDEADHIRKLEARRRRADEVVSDL